jgi:glucose-1-phosphate cytidylyltransferase
MRLRDYSESVPKPMVPIGRRPILWHVMKYYAHFGHKDFILCLGYKGEVIKEFFLNYNEAISNDFVLSDGGRTIELLESDIQDWRITFVETGLHSPVGERLRLVQPHIGDDEMFLANYGDVLTDAPLPDMIAQLKAEGKVAGFLCVRPGYTFHIVRFQEGQLAGIDEVKSSEIWINGGYFVFRRGLFDYIEEGEELEVKPFERLIAAQQMRPYRYEGFWAPMDTLKDREVLEALCESAQPPWWVWNQRLPGVQEQARRF